MIVLEFFLGMIIAHIFHSLPAKKELGYCIFFAGIVLLLASINTSLVDVEMDRFYKWGLPSALLVYGAISIKQVSQSLLKLLGDASYSIYLVHMLVIPVFYKVCASYKAGIDTDMLAISCLLLSILAGVFSFLFIERPLTEGIRKRLQ